MRHPPRLRTGSLLLAIVIAAVAAACTSTESRYPTAAARDTADGDTMPEDTTGGNVSRVSLSVRVRSHSDDSVVAAALGWTDGTVSSAQVVIRREGSAIDLSAATDSSGEARFTELLTGNYNISAVRILTNEEKSRLSAADADIDAFGGAVTVRVPATGLDTSIITFAGRRGSLVISELYRNAPFNPEGQYQHGKYLEMYNNSDTTVTLADKIYVKGFPGGSEGGNFPCSVYEDIRNDPEGIWAMAVYAFPSSARTLAPGQLAVIAGDAIDHSALQDESFDLSRADFEFPGTADVDNPRVPNMITLGPNAGLSYFGHGFNWHEVTEVLVLAEAVPLEGLPIRNIPNSTTRWIVRIPAERILDVLVDRYVLRNPRTPCPTAVHPRFDRQTFAEVTDLDTRDTQRRVIGTLPDGRKILLRTRTSARDFEARLPTPGFLP